MNTSYIQDFIYVLCKTIVGCARFVDPSQESADPYLNSYILETLFVLKLGGVCVVPAERARVERMLQTEIVSPRCCLDFDVES